MTLRNQKAFALLWPAPPFPTSLCLDSGFQTHHWQMQKNVKARDVYCGFFFCYLGCYGSYFIRMGVYVVN